MSIIKDRITLPCVVCFGDLSSELAKGFTWGIWILLALPFIMILIIGTKIYFASKKTRSVKT
ncbi:MAG: hypothetical protein HY400_02985 [Elusimicrobia bacterium]|nr:hypothetical protein [Elusimicrobiota bacterium]